MSTTTRASQNRSSIVGAVGTPLPHDSASLHVNGGALYTDDIPEPRGLLHAALGISARPHALIKKIDLSAVTAADGVVAVMVASDIPGKNDFGAVVADDPIFSPSVVQYVGQPIFAVAADTVDAARRAAKLPPTALILITGSNPGKTGRRMRRSLC